MPNRLVSLVPSMTETVCALGARDRLVGITRYCVHPAAELQSVPRIGGTKNPNRDKIAALAPDLIIANSEENRAEDLAWLRARFPVLEHRPKTVVDAATAIRDLARLLDALDQAQPLLLRIEAQIARAQVEAIQRGELRVFYAVWRDPWMGANADTYIHDLLRRVGAVNVCTGMAARYPEVDPGALHGQVDLVLLPSEPYAFTDAERQQVLADELFGKDVPVLLCDGRDFCWHGAHTAEGLGNALRLLLPLRPLRP